MIGALIGELRPRQWTKNLLIFAGVLFSQHLTDRDMLLRATAGFVAFSLLSGCVYMLNDLKDLEVDRLHPRKRSRPLASGRLPAAAVWVAVASAAERVMVMMKLVRANPSRSVSVSSRRPSWHRRAVRRSQRSSSMAQARITGVTRAGSQLVMPALMMFSALPVLISTRWTATWPLPCSLHAMM